MPCNSDYLAASSFEKAMSRVLCLLAELETGKRANKNSDEWRGYHPKVYNKSMPKPEADAYVAALCGRIQLLSPEDLSRKSLELQIWWRDHQIADRERIAKEAAILERIKLQKSALSKLTKEEKMALGIKTS